MPRLRSPLSCSIAGCGGSSTRVVHLGCHEYCQQAGGYGGGPAGAPTVKFESRGDVSLNSDGSVTIKQTCLMPVPCDGALVIAPTAARLEFVCKPTVGRANWWGQSDLTLAAEQTEAIAVPLSACARQQLSKQGRVKVLVTADASRVPACSKIPALAQACHRFVTVRAIPRTRGTGSIVS